METLLGLLLNFSSQLRAVGFGIFSLSLGAITLGLRLGRRIDRIEHTTSRVGPAVQIQLDQLLPWWVAPLVPETTQGFIAWELLGCIGLVMAATAKRLRKLHL